MKGVTAIVTLMTRNSTVKIDSFDQSGWQRCMIGVGPSLVVGGLRWWQLVLRAGGLRFAGESDEDGLQDDVEDRDEEEVEDGGEHHAADDGRTDRVAAIGSGAGGEVERADAEDEGDGGHQDGAEAEFGGFDGGFDDGPALLEELLGELDDEDRVFGGEADEHDEADLDVDVVDQAAEVDERERAEDRHGNGKQDDERQREGLVLGREREIDDEQAEAEDDDGLAGGLDLFESEAGPGVGHARHLVFVEELHHGVEALAGAEARCGRAVDLGRAEEIVVVDDLRAGGLGDGGEVVEGNHLAGVGADVVLADILRVAAIGRVGLDVDAVGAVVEVEVVDVARAHEGVEGRGDLAEGNAHGLGLLAVDGDEKLRIVGGEGGVHAGEAGAGSAALTDESVGDAVDIAEGVAAGVLQDELEAADGADAGDGGRLRGEGDAAGDAEELRPDVGNDGFGGKLFGPFWCGR